MGKKKGNTIIIMLIFVLDILFFRLFLYKLSDNITYSAKVKIEELTKYHLNH